MEAILKNLQDILQNLDAKHIYCDALRNAVDLYSATSYINHLKSEVADYITYLQQRFPETSEFRSVISTEINMLQTIQTDLNQMDDWDYNNPGPVLMVHPRPYVVMLTNRTTENDPDEIINKIQLGFHDIGGLPKEITFTIEDIDPMHIILRFTLKNIILIPSKIMSIPGWETFVKHNDTQVNILEKLVDRFHHEVQHEFNVTPLHINPVATCVSPLSNMIALMNLIHECKTKKFASPNDLDFMDRFLSRIMLDTIE